MKVIEEVRLNSIEFFCSISGTFLQIAAWGLFFVTYFTFLSLSLAIQRPEGNATSCHNSHSADRNLDWFGTGSVRFLVNLRSNSCPLMHISVNMTLNASCRDAKKVDAEKGTNHVDRSDCIRKTV